ncbi:hypothetical protein Pmani_029840 [Petrolisthes manimaculis]|uniref:Uncharacterized protein n=1 Tax=Petrolisthes manimaculis TaxID=1843537 RepID=A0AAE1NYJ9_9EUCA|nr:hypothetical protein Pmani_029840 [Petrolisthes manimaculis]
MTMGSCRSRFRGLIKNWCGCVCVRERRNEWWGISDMYSRDSHIGDLSQCKHRQLISLSIMLFLITPGSQVHRFAS